MKEESEGKPSKWENYGCFALVFVLTCGMFVLRAAEESFGAVKVKASTEQSHYETLDVSKDAPLSDIKKKYKKLAIRWHPDKNPNCDSCAERFGEIAKAYEILSDNEKRQVYDTTAGEYESISSGSSVTLTEQNYDALVTHGDSVWVIQAFSELEPRCGQFAPHWEEASNYLGRYARFGRIDATRNPDALKKFPIKARLFPTVVMVAKGYEPRIFPMGNPSFAELKKWFNKAYPDVMKPTDWENLGAGQKAQVLTVSSKPDAGMLMKSLAYQYGGIFDFMKGKPSEMKSGSELKTRLKFKGNEHTIMAVFTPGHSGMPQEVVHFGKTTKKQLEDKIQTSLFKFQQKVVPFLDRRTVERLCGSSQRRVYCLVCADPLVSNSTALHPENILESLGSSRDRYLVDLEDGDEPVVVQPVQVTNMFNTGFDNNVQHLGSHAPWLEFQDKFLQGQNQPGIFMLDLEMQRFATIDDQSADDLYQILSVLEYKEFKNMNDDDVEQDDDAPPADRIMTFQELLVDPDETWFVQIYRRLMGLSTAEMITLAVALVTFGAARTYLDAKTFIVLVFVGPMLGGLVSSPIWTIIAPYTKPFAQYLGLDHLWKRILNYPQNLMRNLQMLGEMLQSQAVDHSKL